MYTILSSKFIKFEGSKSIQRVEIVCDTEADLPTPEEIDSEGFTVGSLAWIADARTFKLLNNKGEWV